MIMIDRNSNQFPRIPDNEFLSITQKKRKKTRGNDEALFRIPTHAKFHKISIYLSLMIH
jgi:hypothetical protein